MFLEHVDWNNPRFSRWNLSRLGKLNQAQLDAFFDVNAIDFPDFTEAELKELSEKVPCHIELFHSNVCYGVEKSWPKRMFNRAKFTDLAPWQKRRLYRETERKGVYLYNKYVSEKRLKKRRTNRSNRALAPYYEERYLKNCFNRIKALGDVEHERFNMSDSDASLVTVINTQNESESPLRYGRTRSKTVPLRSRSRSKRSKPGPRRSKSSPQRSKSRASVYSDSSTEIDKESRIIYDHSSEGEEDEYLSANEEEFSQRRRSNRSAPASAASPNDIKSDTSSPFVTPRKEMDDLTPIITPNIEQLRQLRSNLFRVDSDDDLAANRSIAMVIEVESESIVDISLPNPILAARKYDDTGIIGRNSIENIDSGSDDSSVDLPLVIDERFNDILSESSVTSSMRNRYEDTESLRLTSTPQIDSSEFVIINSNDLDKLRGQIDENVEIFPSSPSSSYSLRHRKTLSNSYSLRHRKTTNT